jgi:hypothetical protein
MNVNVFKDSPSIKWYFISAVPFMLCVLGTWFFFKEFFKQPTPDAGVYDKFYNEMATTNPQLWSQTGPREFVAPKGRVAKMKWRLIQNWAAPEKLAKTPQETPAGSNAEPGLGAINKVKRHLMRKWTAQLERAELSHRKESLEDGGPMDDKVSESGSVVADGLAGATDVLVIPATPAVEQAVGRGPAAGLPHATGHSYFEGGVPGEASDSLVSQSHRRSSSPGRASGILIEEEDTQILSERGAGRVKGVSGERSTDKMQAE